MWTVVSILFILWVLSIHFYFRVALTIALFGAILLSVVMAILPARAQSWARSASRLITSALGGNLLQPSAGHEHRHTLAHAHHVPRQWQPAALFQDGDQLVELRPGVRTGEHDADGMEQVFAVGAGLGLHVVHDGLEPLGRERVRLR